MSKTNPYETIDGPTPTLLGTRPPMPVLICRDGKVVGDAVVIVSPRDPNWYRKGGKFNGEIRIGVKSGIRRV